VIFTYSCTAPQHAGGGSLPPCTGTAIKLSRVGVQTFRFGAD